MCILSCFIVTGAKQLCSEPIMKLGRMNVQVEWLDNPSTSSVVHQSPNDMSCYVEVSNIPASVGDMALRYFLENRRVAGGTRVEDVKINGTTGKAIVKFSSALGMYLYILL